MSKNSVSFRAFCVPINLLVLLRRLRETITPRRDSVYFSVKLTARRLRKDIAHHLVSNLWKL